ncbi:MAG: response regulator [Labilibaculum antarcticum]
MDHKIKILHLEDSINDSELIHSIIESSGIEKDYYWVDNENDFIHFLKTKKIDIILSDYSLPGYQGNEALKIASQDYSHIPFIFVSGTIGEDKAIDAMKNGATDYVLKDKLERLIPAIKRAVREYELETKRKNDELELKEKTDLIETQNEEKEKRANELFIANKELTFQNQEKEKREAELVVANKELLFQNEEKEKRASELVLANKELAFQNKEKEKRASELAIANKELLFQNEEKEKRAAELVLANKELAFQNEEKEKRAAELVIAKDHAEESDRLKSAFLANMSHEIRTPMNGILGFAELLKGSGLKDEKQEEYVRIIAKSGNRLLNIINDILDISKIESGFMTVSISEVNINEQMEYVYKLFKHLAEDKGISLSCKSRFSEEKTFINSDKEKLYAILTNLVKNAIKYTDKGTVQFGYEEKENDVEFYVTDTGIGIPSSRCEAIFDRFIQADISDKEARQGAGLGLAIAKEFTVMLGGNIWVESEEGKGSTFYFTLPRKTEIEKHLVVENNSTFEMPVTEKEKLKILIAEDDEESEKLLSIIIKELGGEFIEARTGVEAVEMCRDTPGIDLIMMDIRMPEMNGYEATRQIRQFNKEVIIIAQTAFGLLGDREKAIGAGCNDYISKPIAVNKLLSLIKKYCNKIN